MKNRIVLKEEKGESRKLSDVISVDAPIPLKIGYIGGGSRGWAHGLMRDLANCPWFTGEVRLYDIDQEAAEFNAAFGNWLQGHPENRSRWHYRAVKTMKAALSGCDFVFLSIQPGPIQLMKHDIEIPMQYGIYQPVGDTVGPGGIIRGFRSARTYAEFGRAIGEYCPKAWAVNFTNPMTVCTRTLYEVFPAAKAFGCCHEVFGTQQMLARMLAKRAGISEPSRAEVRVNVLGINHFTWIDSACCRGLDLLEMAREEAAKPANRRFYTKKLLDRKLANVFESMSRVKYELLSRYGVMAAAGDRHLAEFVPWFLTDRDSCYKWGFVLTPYSYRIERWRKARSVFVKQMKSKEPIPLGGSGEEYLNQMAAIMGLAEFRTNVNLPNIGQMGKIPHGAVVETNAVFSHDRVEPIASGSLPDQVNALVYPHVVNQEAVIKAALCGDEDLGFQAFANDPLVHRLSIDAAHEMYRRMLKATGFVF